MTEHSLTGALHGFTIELTDLNTSTMFRSKYLTYARLNSIMPHPVNYKMVWAQSVSAGLFVSYNLV